MADLNPAWIALIGTVMGGTGLQLLKTWLDKGQRKDTQEAKLRSEAAELRGELRLQIEDLRAEAERLHKEVEQIQLELDTWKEKYYELLAKYNDTQFKLVRALAELRDEWEEDALLKRTKDID